MLSVKGSPRIDSPTNVNGQGTAGLGPGKRVGVSLRICDSHPSSSGHTHSGASHGFPLLMGEDHWPARTFRSEVAGGGCGRCDCGCPGQPPCLWEDGESSGTDPRHSPERRGPLSRALISHLPKPGSLVSPPASCKVVICESRLSGGERDRGTAEVAGPSPPWDKPASGIMDPEGWRGLGGAEVGVGDTGGGSGG